MGPNGSGKSTLLNAIMGNPACIIESGTLQFDGKNINKSSTSARARMGLFMTFQNPVALSGVPFAHVIQAARETTPDRFVKTEQHLSPSVLASSMRTVMDRLGLDKQFIYRSLNEGFSGGEKKKAELIQLALLEPTLALIDEIDSGLDIDALRTVCTILNELHVAGMILLIVTHNPRLVDFIQPDRIHILLNGRIACSGTASLSEQIDADGYESFAS